MKTDFRNITVNYAVAAAAATVAESATFPLDLTKTRLQIQGEVASIAASSGNSGSVLVKRGMLSVALGVVKEEGLLKLWQGLLPAVYRHLIYTGFRMGSYEKIREVFGRNPDGSFPVYKAVVGGFVAGSLGQFVASPMDLVKVQMQMDGKRQMEGMPRRVHGVGQCIKSIIKTGGIRGLWAGWVPNVQRAALVNMGDLATYDVVKHSILRNTSLEDNWVCHALASLCSGLAAATLSTPADVVKTRIMNQPRDSNGNGLFYKSPTDCLRKTISKEGFFGLYKGFIPIWSRMAPWSLTFWLTCEEIRKLAGLSTF